MKPHRRLPAQRIQAAWLLLALALAGSAAAQNNTVYRCAKGVYANSPCPGGEVIDAADPRSAEQVRQARDAAQGDRALARQLAAERRAEEAAAARRPPPVAGIALPTPPAAKPPAPAKLPKKRRAARHKPPTPPIYVGPAAAATR